MPRGHVFSAITVLRDAIRRCPEAKRISASPLVFNELQRCLDLDEGQTLVTFLQLPITVNPLLRGFAFVLYNQELDS